MERKLSDDERDAVESAYDQVIGGFGPQINWPTAEEREAHDLWLQAVYEDASAWERDPMRVQLLNSIAPHREELCRFWVNHRTLLNTDGAAVAVALADTIISIGLQCPVPVTQMSILLLKRGVLDKICGTSDSPSPTSTA